MTGPYTAEVFLDQSRQPDFTLSWDENRQDLEAGDSIASLFYRGPGGATLLGTLRAATFYVSQLLEPGEEATVMLQGFHGGEPAIAHGGVWVSRDTAGRVLSSLGSRSSRPRYFRSL